MWTLVYHQNMTNQRQLCFSFSTFCFSLNHDIGNHDYSNNVPPPVGYWYTELPRAAKDKQNNKIR